MILCGKKADYPYCLHSSFYYNTICQIQQAEVFPKGFSDAENPSAGKQMGSDRNYRNITIILMHMQAAIRTIPKLVKKHFRHRLSIHSAFR